MSMRYSLFNVIVNGLTGNRFAEPAWRDADAASRDYDVVIVGGGGHGLATAYYLAKDHGITQRRGAGEGLDRLRQCRPQHHHRPLQLPAAGQHPVLRILAEAVGGAGAGPQLQRHGQPARRAQPVPLRRASATPYARRGNAMRLHGVDAELLDREQVRAHAARSSISTTRAFPIQGGLLQRARRHGAARRGRLGLCPRRRPARRRHHPELRGHRHHASTAAECVGVETTRGFDRRQQGRRWPSPATPRASRRWPGCALPIESHVLQAFVSEALKPLIDGVITFGAGHFYISQSDKGGLVFGGDIDGYNSYAQRGNLPMVEDVLRGRHGADARCSAALRVLRHWGGIMDMSMDGSPIIDRTPIDGLYLNAGWCYGGFKATPASGWCFAHLIARDEPHAVAAALSARPVRTRPSDRRKGQRRPARTCTEATDAASPVPIAASATHDGVRLSRRRRPRRARRRRRRPARRWSTTTSICATIRAGRMRELLVSCRRLPRLAGGDARHARPTRSSRAVRDRAAGRRA